MAAKYHPLHFLRAHAKNNNPADVSTQVWQCAFEPDCRTKGQHTNIVATCGGYSVCLIDVRTGCVQHKFNSEDVNEQFYSLAWGSLLGGESLLAVSGTKRRVYFLVPSQSVCLCSNSLVSTYGKHVAVNSLLFHPKQNNILFCGLSSGGVAITKINRLDSNSLELEVVNMIEAPDQELFQLAFVNKCSTLLAACSQGLYAWSMENLESKRKGFKIDLPPPPGSEVTSLLVDTVVSLGDSSLVASKRVLEGHILVWDLASALAARNKKNGLVVTHGRFLKWSDSDNYYMGLGWDDRTKMLACGDDIGSIWLYDLHKELDNIRSPQDPPLPVSSIVKWPQKIRDVALDKKRKLRLNVYDIVVAKVALANNYLVTVTNNNMVCVYNTTPGNK